MRIAQWIIYCPKEWIRASLHFTFVRQFRKKKFFCVSKLVREGKTRKVFFLLFHRPLGTDYFICMCHAGKNKISQGNQLERLNISCSNLWCKYFPFFSYFLKIYLESVYNQLICSKSLASYQLTAAKFCTVMLLATKTINKRNRSWASDTDHSSTLESIYAWGTFDIQSGSAGL